MHNRDMMSWYMTETKRENKYLYDRVLRRTQLCHPILFYIAKLKSANVDINTWFDKLEKDPVNIPGYGIFSKKEITYYFKKFLLLQSNGHFTKIDHRSRFGASISSEIVKNTLANCKQVTFEVTDRCGLCCEYCAYGKFYSDYDQRKNINLDTQTAIRLLDYLRELWISPLNRSHDKNIYISFYGGECLENFPFIQEIVNYVKQLNLPHNRFTFSMTTNGILLDKYIDYLIENDFRLLISLDGNAQNNAYRVFKNGKPSFDTIYKNALVIKENHPDYFFKCVNFNAVLHNKNTVSDIYHFFKTDFDKIPIISSLNTSGIKESLKSEFWKKYSNINDSLYQSEDYSLIEKEMFIKLPNVKDLSIFIHRCSDFWFEDYNDLMYPTWNQKRIPTGTCLPFSKRIFVTAIGKILPCERIGHQYSFGYVTPSRVELDFEQIAEKYNKYLNRIRKSCLVCHNAENCIQCMFNLDSLESEEPVCNGLMSEIDYGKYLASFLDKIENDPGIYSRILNEVIIE